MKIAHIVNPVLVGQSSDLFIAQPVTFSAMFAAKRFAIDDVDVDLMAIGYDEDETLIPTRFAKLPSLKRSVLDVAQFKKKRKLPLIKDILDAAIKQSDADYFIYTNVDISPMPYFYSTVCDALNHNDALVINRRTIAKADSADTPLSQFYCQAGEPHPGFDCFVFSRSQYQNYKLYDACIGANWIGRVLICNLLAYSANPKIMTDEHLTFHLGDDRSWKTAANIPFDTHNENQVGRLMQQLHDEGLTEKHVLLSRSFKEFHLKTIDPDPSRPKTSTASPNPTTAAPTSVPKATTHPNHVASAPDVSPCQNSYSILPTKFLPSKPWQSSDSMALRQDPVFVVGHPRSGTTLLQSLVATQFTPAVFPETHFFSIVRKRINLANERIQACCLDKVFAFLDEKLNLTDGLKSHIRKLVADDQLSSKMFFEALVFDQLTQRLPTQDVTAMQWMEKTPDHAEHLDAIGWYYPNAKFIFIVRHPEKAILSRRKHFTWNDEANWPIAQHADRWIQTVKAVQEYKTKHPGKIHYVRFEDLVADQHQQIQAICQFLNVAFKPESLTNQKQFTRQQSMNWETWKQNAQAPISTQIAGGVTDKLSAADTAELNARLHPYLQQFGYTSPSSKQLVNVA